jgi:hypothetical protein
LGFDNEALDKLGINLEGDNITSTLAGDERRVTPEDKLKIYENTTLRQIVLIMDVSEFGDIMAALDNIKKAKDLETNTEAALAAIRNYANTCS